MSAEATSAAWHAIADGRVSSLLGRVVLLRLADQADRLGVVRGVGIKSLADGLIASRRGVQQSLATLESVGLLRVERTRSRDGRDQPAIFWVCTQCAPPCAFPAQGEGALNAHLRGAHSVHPVVVVVKNNKNNNNSPPALQFDAALLSQAEQQAVLQAVGLAPAARQQHLADEIFGQARAKKSSKSSIKNFGMWARSIILADQRQRWAGEHHYAAGEAELRAARAAALEREARSYSAPATLPGDRQAATKPPPEIRAWMDAIRADRKKG